MDRKHPITSLVTDYELGLASVIPLRLHLHVDVIGGAILALTPLIFGTTDEGLGAWLPHVVVGISVVLAGLLTEPERGLHHEGERRAARVV